MHRLVDVTAFDRIVVNVFQLLKHHLLALNQLRMISFLPELIATLGFMAVLVPFELPQQRYRGARL